VALIMLIFFYFFNKKGNNLRVDFLMGKVSASLFRVSDFLREKAQNLAVSLCFQVNILL